ncbi:MAG: ATP-binding cassette domain-containing protein, partial [Proteobacteria bacterium]|nr:ATP-binding cassette domain-containing protein [Pseudomonadota bacterium]
NGSGKSTLLCAIAGVLEPRAGRITIDGASVWGSQAQRTRARRALGYVPEAADPPGFLTADELWNLCSATRATTPPSAALCAALGLDELRGITLDKMSLGMRRRACLGAAFLGPPNVLVLDEPDNGLDAQRLDALAILLRARAAAGQTAIVASHDAAYLDRLEARRVVLTPRP